MGVWLLVQYLFAVGVRTDNTLNQMDEQVATENDRGSKTGRPDRLERRRHHFQKSDPEKKSRTHVQQYMQILLLPFLAFDKPMQQQHSGASRKIPQRRDHP
jgi:hypothetical protein